MKLTRIQCEMFAHEDSWGIVYFVDENGVVVFSHLKYGNHLDLIPLDEFKALVAAKMQDCFIVERIVDEALMEAEKAAYMAQLKANIEVNGFWMEGI